MAAAQALFEVHVRREGRWTIDDTSKVEADALAFARKLAGQSGVESVKVMREGPNKFGRVTNEAIFTQERQTTRDDRIVLPMIDRAAPCEKREALYGIAARLTMTRLFKPYLTRFSVTPSEVMYNAREMKRVMDKDNLVATAVGRVAGLQARGDQAAAKQRRDMLHGFVDEIADRARKADTVKLPDVSKVGLQELESDVVTRYKDESDADYMMRVAIARALVNERNWWGKLDRSVGWAAAGGSPRSVAALDDFIADTLADAALLQDILGPQRDLYHALAALLDLIEGKAPPRRSGGAETEMGVTVDRLVALMQAGKLPGAVAVLFDRLRGQLAQNSPLTKNGKIEDEEDAYRNLLLRLVPGDRPLLGGGEMAAALVERMTRLTNRGGVGGRKDAVEQIVQQLREPHRQLGFMFAVRESAIVMDVADTIDALLDRIIVQSDTVHDLDPGQHSPIDLMRFVTSLYYLIEGSNLTGEGKRRLLDHIDQLLLDFVRDENILSRLDSPNLPLRKRTEMLMGLCLPVILPPGKAVAAARAIIIGYLRQPNFEMRLVEDIANPVEKATVLRRIFDTMKRAGFG
ncbi:MAG: hypothetical protein J0H82_03060 [Alphaproteobacteria bacterium]|jgi:hypothetical protein|nr:hypothetical protein [Alphaproteobacteria bacterium]